MGVAGVAPARPDPEAARPGSDRPPVRLPFRDRAAAGQLLGEALRARLGTTGRDAVVLGIPRGGVVTAEAVATALGASLDVVVARKIGAPGQPELAVGAATADGTILLEPWASDAGADEGYLATASARAVEAARAREALLRAGRPRIPLAGRTAIVVDDGIATGATMHAAVLAARAAGAARVIVAAPVGAAESVGRLGAVADELVVLATPYPFYAVGEFFGRFEQTTDEQVVALLAGRGGPERPPGDATEP